MHLRYSVRTFIFMRDGRIAARYGVVVAKARLADNDESIHLLYVHT